MSKKLLFFMLAALLLFTIQVSAQDDVMEMDEVVVTASRYEESIMDTPVSIEVIDEEEIEESNANNLADLLNLAGGIHIKNNGTIGDMKDVNIRGLKEDKILILIDGQPYSDPYNNLISLETIPVEYIKRIEVLKSPSSAIYGPNAMGGVINIITKDGKDIEKATFNFGIGSYDKQKFNIVHSFNGENSSMLFVYDFLDSNGHRDNSSINRNDIFVKSKYYINDITDFAISLKLNETELEYPGIDASELDYTPSYSPAGEKEEKDMNVKFSVNQNFPKKDRKIDVYFNEKEIVNIPGGFRTIYDINKIGTNISEQYYFDNHSLIYGLEFVQDKVTAGPSIGAFEEGNLNKAIFIEDQYTLNNKNKFNLGFRFDDHEQYGSEFSPNFGYIYKINDSLNFNLNYNESFAAPQFRDLYYQSSYGDYSNPNLKPETSINYSLGFKYLHENCFREVAFFKRDIEEYITYPGFLPTNTDKVEIKGFELITNRKINNNFEVNFNYTYLDTLNKDTNEELGDIPNHEASLKFKYNLEDSYISFNNKYYGSRIDGGSRKSVDLTEGKILPAHFVSDLKLSTLFKDNTEISVGINNLFNKDYSIVDGYRMPGRNFMVNVSTKF